MKLSTKGRYGTHIMLDLALHYGKGRMLLKDIAKRREVSVNYLEHLMPALKAAQLVKSNRGAHGGYTLAKPPQQIKLIDIIQTLEGSLAPVECVDTPQACHRANSCVNREIWSQMKVGAEKVLKSTTLQDMVERYREKEGTEKAMYHI